MEEKVGGGVVGVPRHVPIPSLDACGGPSQTVRIPAVLDATCQQPSILSLCLSDATSKGNWKTACHVTQNNHKRLCHVLFSLPENIEDGQMYRTEQSCVSVVTRWRREASAATS